MKIISKFHDYYDSAMAYGIDESVVYMRQLMEFEEAWDYRSQKNINFPERIKELYQYVRQVKTQLYDNYYYINNLSDSISTKDVRLNIEQFVIVFCGEVHKGLRFSNDQYSRNRINECFYDSESIEKFLGDLEIDVHKKQKVGWSKKKNTSFADQLKKFFDYPKLDEDYFIVNKVTAAMVCSKEVKINPVLKDYDFYRVYDPYQAYQKLDMWVSGTLAYPQNFMVEIEDKYKVAGHGFDEKYGFRKRPKE